MAAGACRPPPPRAQTPRPLPPPPPLHHNGLIDQAARVFSIVGTSFPTFVFGLLVLMIFYANLQWFPPGRLSDWASQIVASDAFRHYTGVLTLDSLLNGQFKIFVDARRHMFLPILTTSYASR